MLDSTEGQRSEKDDQKQLSDSQGALHNDKYPFIQEFSGFLATVSTASLKYKLMTYQQRLFAKSLWEAQNYGGSQSKCIAHLKEIYGPKWHQITSVSEHMEEERAYCEYVLILDHQRQWENAKKMAKLPQNEKF